MDTGIDSIYYFKDYYDNGDLKEAGWKIRSKQNNKVFRFKDSLGIANLRYIELKVGVYKHFNKNNKIEGIIYFPNNIKDTIRTELFNKKGELIYLTKTIRIHEYEPICCDEVENFKKEWPYKYYYFANYKNGIIESDGYYKNNYDKTGRWREFDNKGNLTEEKYY